MRALLAAVVLLSTLCGASQTARSDSPISVQVYWAVNGPPQNISIDYVSATADLQIDTNKSHFIGQINLGSDVVVNGFVAAILRANYPDGVEETVPIKLGPGIDTVRLRMFHPATLDCGDQTVSTIEQPASDPDLLLKRYIIARALYRMEGTNRCGPYMIKRVVKAWFDRSYGLAKLRPFFTLDEDARDEAKRVLPTSYVDNYTQQAASVSFKILNNAKIVLIKRGEYENAAKINSVLLKAIESDPSIGQGLTNRQLILDHSFIETITSTAAVRG